MSPVPLFKEAAPYADDLLALPVEDLDRAAEWYSQAFGLREVERRQNPVPAVIMERDGIRIGFAVNAGDACNEGAAIRVADIDRARDEFTSNGLEIGEGRIDERDGRRFQVFFVVAPDGLCYYFYQPIDGD